MFGVPFLSQVKTTRSDTLSWTCPVIVINPFC
jgi:hypothetical protein